MFRRLLIASFLLPAAVFGQQWKLIAPMNEPRDNIAGILLDDGRILVAGGGANGNALKTTETYDAKTGVWAYVGNFNSMRGNTDYACTKLPNGKVLIVGGWIPATSTTLSTTEIFDPSTNSWSYSTPLGEPLEAAYDVPLQDGRVLITCGAVGGTYNYTRTCEIFDPKTNSMKYTGSINQGRFDANVITIPSTGHVILFGGHYNGAYGTWLNDCQEYDTATGVWAALPSSQVSHSVGTSLLLPDEKIIAVSGSMGPANGSTFSPMTPLIEVFDPLLKQWAPFGNLPFPRAGQKLVSIGLDSILVIGGIEQAGDALADCEIINIKTGAITPGPKMNYPRVAFVVISQTIHPTPCSEIQRVYVMGGYKKSNKVDEIDSSLASCEILEFQRGVASILTLPQPLSLNGNVCAGIDTSVSIAVSGCSDFRLDSAVVEGLPNSSLVAKLPDTLQSGESKSIQLSFHSTTAGISQGLVKMFYNAGGAEQDTSIPITLNMKASTRGTIHCFVHDILSGGDTVSIPVYLASNSGDKAEGFQLTAHYNTDLLTPIDPEFTGTLTAGAIVWDQNNVTGGITMYADQPFSISTSKPLVILKFKTAVTKQACTSFVIDNLQISFDSTGTSGDPCPLAVTGDSAMICRANECGDNTLRGFLTSGMVPGLSASYDRQSERIIIDEKTNGHYEIELLNMLGEVVSKASVSVGRNYISVSALPAGIYIVRSSNSQRVLSQKISLTK